jgi:C4-dicarboxylate-specific signal transduction histidine kinase
MATTMAHELNQPLGAISNYAAGCATMIRDDTGNRETLLDAMERIAAEARRAARVIRRTRRFVGRRERELTEVNLNDVVRDVIELLDHETSVEGIVVTADLADPAPETVGDRVLLQQVVTNLLKNAVEALVAEGARNPTVLIQTRHTGPDVVQTSVIDNGSGLTDEQLDHVFDPYYTTRAEGLGLGLAICRSIIEDHGGRLTVRRHDPNGASFQFTLPSAGRASRLASS